MLPIIRGALAVAASLLASVYRAPLRAGADRNAKFGASAHLQGRPSRHHRPLGARHAQGAPVAGGYLSITNTRQLRRTG